MRLVRYNVAASLDGFIAAEDGGYDWIPTDPAEDLTALFAKVDTVLLGRHSADLLDPPEMRAVWRADMRFHAFSESAPDDRWPWATRVRSADAAAVVTALRNEPGDGEIWLFGGGTLFASMLGHGLVDRVEIAVVPMLLGRGIPLTSRGIARTSLRLVSTTPLAMGVVMLSYEVMR
jgi:dihydrofolate reductase